MKNESFHPLVSIIIPVYNGKNYVKEAIDSALAQTYDNIEIIVVNDGSTDNTEKIVKSYGSKIRYYKKENGGVATALNLAIKKAKGEYISWLSHDDIYLKSKIEKQILAIQNNNDKNKVIYGGYSCIDEKKRFLYDVDLLRFHDENNLSKPMYSVLRGCLNGCTMLIPKKIFYKVSFFDENLKNTQDYDLWFKFAKKGIKFKFVKGMSVASRLHSHQSSKINPKVIDEGNSLWISMLSNISKKDIKKIDSHEINFYKKTLEILESQKFFEASKYVREKIKIKKSKLFLEKSDFSKKISVIIPCYNQGLYLEDAVNSVFAQKYDDFEIIIVNDGSNDKSTLDYLNKVIYKDTNKIKVYNLRNSGRSHARNFGIKKSTGNFIQLLDADDYLLSNKFNRQINFFEKNPEFQSTYSSFYYISESTNKKRFPEKNSLIMKGNQYLEFLLKWQRPISIPIHTFLFKRECFDKIKFREDVEVCEDWMAWVEMAKKGINFYFDDFLGAVYRIHDNNTTKNSLDTLYNAILAIGIMRKNLQKKQIKDIYDKETIEYIKLVIKPFMFENHSYKSEKRYGKTINDKLKILFFRVDKIVPNKIRKKIKKYLIKNRFIARFLYN